jgi:ParB family chromosome partitioning protein
MKLATEVERVSIASIHVGERRRQKLGRLGTLARSIKARGLLHPILLRNGNQLVAGQRRLEACKQLGWTTIPARRVDGLSDEELREVELEENTERLALLDYEASKARLAEIRQAEAEARAEAEEKLRPDSGRKSRPAHRPTKPGSQRDVAARTGLARTSVQNIEKHVAVADLYPFMQKPEWKQHNVLEAAEELQAIPERERPALAAILDQPALPPKKAIQMIHNLGAMPAEERQRLLTLARSDDSHDRRVAATSALQLPPPPDAGLLKLKEAVRLVRHAAKVTRADAVRTDIERSAEDLEQLGERVKEATTR